MKNLLILIFLMSLLTIACSKDPGSSYVKNGEYNKAIAVYNEKISEEYANSDLVRLNCYKAIAYAKMGNAGAAWGTWKVARAINSYVGNENQDKKAEQNKILANSAKIIKKELAMAAQNRSAQRAAVIERQKPVIYKRGVALMRRGKNLAALRQFSAIPDYRDSRRRIAILRRKLGKKINSLWQQGFALYSAESYSRAIRFFNRILAINPAHRNAKIYKQKAQAKLKALRKF